MNQADMLTRFVRETDVDLVMPAGRCTLLDASGLKDLLPEALRRGVGVLAAGVFNPGLRPATIRKHTPTSTTDPLPRTWCSEPAALPPCAASTAAP
jgi:D-threo-aldose 1-dehydrogenase